MRHQPGIFIYYSARKIEIFMMMPKSVWRVNECCTSVVEVSNNNDNDRNKQGYKKERYLMRKDIDDDSVMLFNETRY